MRLADGTVSGFEALLRWTHPVKGQVETQEFVAHSEESGAILELGKLALTQAAKELACWQRDFPLDPALTVSVNLSRRQLQDSEFEGLLANVVSSGSIHRGTLRLELTETALADVDDVRNHLMRLKSLGAGLSLDDFGTGLSALSQLRDLPFDTIKIDKSFLDHEGNREESLAILRSVVQLAHELNRTVVAEGVETALDVQSLKNIGCEFAQGYFFSPPLPRSDVLAFIASHHAKAGKITADASSVSGMGGKPGDIDPELA
jgi:EAL domain-containing protein (putative c-di-GMP-specific phosphodiesterase class I)